MHGMGLSYWIPLHGTGTYNSMTTRELCNTYRTRSNMGPSFMFSTFPYETTPIDADYPWDWYRNRIKEYRIAQPLYRGDYYPLTDATPDTRQWAVYQMHRPDLNEGFILAFRRQDSPYSAATFKLHGLDPMVMYDIYEVLDESYEMSSFDNGDAMMSEGIEIALPEILTSKMIFYRKFADVDENGIPVIKDIRAGE